MIWILVKYADGTGAMTECEAPSASVGMELMKMFFTQYPDMAHHDGACVCKITAIDPHNPSDYAEVAF